MMGCTGKRFEKYLHQAFSRALPDGRSSKAGPIVQPTLSRSTTNTNVSFLPIPEPGEVAP